MTDDPRGDRQDARAAKQDERAAKQDARSDEQEARRDAAPRPDHLARQETRASEQDARSDVQDARLDEIDDALAVQGAAGRVLTSKGPVARAVHRLVIATIVLYLFLAAIASVGFLVLLALSNDGKDARRGLCAFKVDVQSRYDSSVMFLRDHPNGIPNIPAPVVRNSQKGQRSTLEALSFLDC